MEVAALYAEPKNWPVFSAETFPTENWRSIDPVLKAVEELLPHGIRVVTTTWGALGSPRAGTPSISRIIRERFGIPTVVHLNIQGKTRQDLEGILRGLHLDGLHNILALGGDPPVGRKDYVPAQLRHRYGSDLVNQIVNLNRGRWLGPDGEYNREGAKTNFGIGVAGFPEVHPSDYRESDGFEASLKRHIGHVKAKVDAGGQYVVTQMLFDAELYLRFRDAATRAGIGVPIVPGVIPFVSRNQVARFVGPELRISVPRALEEALRGAGEAEQGRIADEHTGALVEKLLEAGAPGIHFYSMNQSAPTIRVLKRLGD